MYAVLFDATKCVGCNKCIEACVADNKLPKDYPSQTSEDDGLSGNRRTSIVEMPDVNRFVKKQCLHCLHPSCESACLVGAMKKTPDGPVVYDSNKCIGCRYCMIACPVGTPRYQWDKVKPFVQKCDMCFDRLALGRPTACVEACPHEALVFGERAKLVDMAHKIIEGEPYKYIQHVYGEHELGGTCELYISDTPLKDILRLPQNLGSQDIPSLAWPLISKTPIIGISVMSGLVGLYWIIERRMHLAAERAAEIERGK